MPSSSARRNDLSSLHPVVRAAVHSVVQQLEQEGLPFRVFESFRTPERQRSLFAQGRTEPGPRVTKAPAWSSYHQYGLAVDFVLFLDGKWSWETGGQLDGSWKRLHQIAEDHGLEPLSWELPHLQYARTSIDRLRAGDYPPDGDDDWADTLRAAIIDWDGAETAPPPPISSGRPPLPEGVSDSAPEEIFTLFSPMVTSSLHEQPDRGLTIAVIQAAQASEHLWGVPTCITLAQFILESAGGKRMPSGSNNPFGIKAREGEPFVVARTREVQNGREVVISAKFRKFASLDDAFSHHGRLLATSPYYRAAMSHKSDPVAFANALTGVYATDPSYGGKLVKLIDQLDLRLYDAPALVTVPPVAIAQRLAGVGLQLGDRGENVTALQQALKRAGYSVGAIDDSFGTLTRTALLGFQADNGLPTTGIADAATMARLNSSPPRPLSRERLTATEEDLRQKGSKTIIEARRTRMLGLVTSALGALGIGNSMVVNSVGEPIATVPATGAQGLEGFLGQITTVLANPQAVPPAEIQGLIGTAGDLLRGLGAGLTPEVVGQVHAAAPRTIFDLLIPMFAQGNNLQTVATGAAAVASSVIPGLGGSVGVLAVGLLARHFANQIAANRLQEHHDGSNLNR